MLVMSPTLMRVAVIVSGSTGADIRRIKADTTWDEISADSLDRAEIFHAIEMEFDCELSDSACEVVSTVGDLAALVDKAKARVSA
jgi:acyl carrier protein